MYTAVASNVWFDNIRYEQFFLILILGYFYTAVLACSNAWCENIRHKFILKQTNKIKTFSIFSLVIVPIIMVIFVKCMTPRLYKWHNLYGQPSYLENRWDDWNGSFREWLRSQYRTASKTLALLVIKWLGCILKAAVMKIPF